jgi:hypothetical protein
MSDAPNSFEHRLGQELKGLLAGPSMGAARDEAILAAAREAATRAAAHAWRRRVTWAMGMAAAIAVAAAVLWPRGYERTGDIRDAFYVARQIKQHRALDGTWDVNKDGVVDAKDVRSLAVAAVKVQ